MDDFDTLFAIEASKAEGGECGDDGEDLVEEDFREKENSSFNVNSASLLDSKGYGSYLSHSQSSLARRSEHSVEEGKQPGAERAKEIIKVPFDLINVRCR